MGAPVVIRCDASPILGGGHLMRCYALAEALAARGAAILFCVNPEASVTVPALSASRHAVAVVERLEERPRKGPFANPILVIADHYDLKGDALAAFADGSRLAVISDAATRPIAADVVIDPNVGRGPEAYAGLVGNGTHVLAGPAYALLRSDFSRLRTFSLAHRSPESKLERIVVSFGLTDPEALAARVVETVRAALPDVAIQAIVSAQALSCPLLKARTSSDPLLTLAIDIGDMAERLARADLAIGAPGGSALERCVLGLPSVHLVIAENQAGAARALEEAGAALRANDGGVALACVLRLLAQDPSLLYRLGRAAASLCDGRGADRVAHALLHL